jgi:beta-ribofuranosylaminobenzene 5'-phosphate synthase
LLLSIGAACNFLRDNLLTPEQIKQISGRGGTSGVGVNAFFNGGLIIDLGHPEYTDAAFIPSAARHASELPPMAVRLPFPEHWQIHLFLVKGHRYAGGDEINFFQHNTPIPAKEALRVLAAVYHGILPAFLTEDFRLLKQSIIDVHSTGFKKRELQGQENDVKSLIEFLNNHKFIAAGMSSMGPLIYAICQDDKPLAFEDIAIKVQNKYFGAYIGKCNGRNTGHEILGAANASTNT